MYSCAALPLPSGTSRCRRPRLVRDDPVGLGGASRPLDRDAVVPTRRVGGGCRHRRAAAARDGEPLAIRLRQPAELQRRPLDAHGPPEDPVARLDRGERDLRRRPRALAEARHDRRQRLLQVPVPVRPEVVTRAVVVEDVRDLELEQALVQVLRHDLDRALDGVDGRTAAEGPAGLPVAGAQPEREPAQVLGKVARVVRAPAHLFGVVAPPQGPERSAVRPGDRVDEAGRNSAIDGARHAKGGGEQVGVPGRVGERPEAAHREPGDGALAAGRAGAVVPVDVGDQALDVPVLPARVAALAVVEPVRVEAAAAAVRHHHDQGQLRGERLGLALRGPRGLVAAGAVQQV